MEYETMLHTTYEHRTDNKWEFFVFVLFVPSGDKGPGTNLRGFLKLGISFLIPQETEPGSCPGNSGPQRGT
jgi:hypothetical protein